jgi:hypothetical protein
VLWQNVLLDEASIRPNATNPHLCAAVYVCVFVCAYMCVLLQHTTAVVGRYVRRVVVMVMVVVVAVG